MSVASFVAAATSLLQGRDSGSTTAQRLRTLIATVNAVESQWRVRDVARVAEIVTFYRSSPGKLAIICDDVDTRQWLAGSLRLALEFDRRPEHGTYAVRANPLPEEAGEIVVVDSKNPLVGKYPRTLVFLSDDH